MSNQALRILYNYLNCIDDVSCDRAFAPAPDFEALLRNKGIPLYGLDTGISIKSVDLLLFTLGYELGITGVLTMLDLGAIPLHADERGEDDPIVIMGGPCVSNPLPYASFIDAFWIGEAEGGFFDLAAEARDIKKRAGGKGRKEILEKIISHPSVWARGKGEARRAIDWNFSKRPPSASVYPVPNLKVIQNHGAVEIMRGCPNGCRFCHAGFWYRPMRQKSAEMVRSEAADFIKLGGYREISLSSLSTGDYTGIGELVESLNKLYSESHISFQLPSLKVSTFSLPLLEKISEVRRSGLTFAVETPEEFWQHAINKEVSLQSVVSIIKEAKKHGWRGAKFYFMIGLPLEPLNASGERINEEEAIVDFIFRAAKETNMNFNVNVGTFVPKPHTPYQWAGQLDEETAGKKLKFIREKLKSRGHKTGVQDPFISVIEGVISRGDAQAGALIEEAWKKGCRLDAWTEYLKRDVWKEIFEAHSEYVSGIMNPGDRNGNSEKSLPWDFIKPGLGSNFLESEAEKSKSGEFTLPCMEKCTHPCGICRGESKIVQNTIHDENLLYVPVVNEVKSETVFGGNTEYRKDPSTYKIIFSFSKSGPGVFYSHLTIVEIFSMAMVRAGLPVLYTGGFNPLPHLEIASPLAIGITAMSEMAAIETQGFLEGNEFLTRMNKVLPEGILIHNTMNIVVASGSKKYSLSALLWGGMYESHAGIEERIPFKDEKTYRMGRLEQEGSLYGVKRLGVLAKNQDDPEQPELYMEAFRKIYPETGA
ncbi:TIGR03936 family radical SAM-associated protein [Leadbettera azotonutricia]|uniref:Radical SAM domain protein n=1 Tax=Leadbettera azotonutricia (strain ATCC BAA-888 / DSM 13862 / ZAS-9) TaxID=545695 RepID=F5YC78_LEAAZ|nr:TIGR03936 family radical SAM-associated protein [Leadbettera azotonutricia]AEF81845.1 radical SAM domain protein [Leadbettera azotonutricia ZAS-9]